MSKGFGRRRPRYERDSDFENLGMGKLMPADFLKLGKERTDAMMTLQNDLLDAYEQASNAWLARVKSEADLWSGLAAKLTKASSAPETVAAYHEGLAERMRMAAEDGKKLAEDTQKVMKRIADLLPNGWSTKI
jgi:hypothetical protein